MGSKKKNEAFTDQEKKAAVQRVLSGETRRAVAGDLGVNPVTVTAWYAKYAEELGERENPETVGPVGSFAKKVRSILWRKGAEEYDKWIVRVEYFKSTGYTLEQAWVRASKEFDAIKPIFRDFDLRSFDRDVGSHPEIEWYGDVPKSSEIECEGIEMSYRECLRWAINAAGLHKRTGQPLKSIPNDSCFYLYTAAIEEQKDFLAKLGQIESKEDAEALLDKNTRRMTERNVDEISKMLDHLDVGLDAEAEELREATELYFDEEPDERLDTVVQQDSGGISTEPPVAKESTTEGSGGQIVPRCFDPVLPRRPDILD